MSSEGADVAALLAGLSDGEGQIEKSPASASTSEDEEEDGDWV